MKTSTFGRLVYIEPNDMASLQGVNMLGGGIPDNVSWNPEDLNMSVDLQVVVPNRSDCGQADLVDGMNKFIVEINNDNTSDIGRYVSFMQGADINTVTSAETKEVTGHELTTDYIEATYSELYRDGKTSKENLGIESIDITFDAHFYPQVNIKFIDVRGYSLMMPAEEEFLANAEIERYGSTERKTYTNFFRAMFHFPYPRFLLTIKGYFGSSITFILAINEFKNSFNSQTGNFEVNVSFIGYMYGLYTDLPFNLLIAAPYYGVESSGGSKSQLWEEKIGSGNYKFDNGSGDRGNSILTFIEFIKRCNELNVAARRVGEGGTEYSNLERKEQIDNEKDQLNKIVGKFDIFVRNVIEENNDVNIKIQSSDSRDVIWYMTNSDGGDIDNIKWNNSNYWNEFVEAWEGYSGELNFPDWLPDDVYDRDNNKWKKGITQLGKYTPFFTQASDGTLSANTNSTGTITYDKLKNERTDIANKIKSQPYINHATKQVTYIFGSYILDVINTKRSSLNDELASMSTRTISEMNNLYNDKLGFIPNILNIYRMIFAHVDCFMTEFYKLLDTIYQKMKSGERTLGNISLDKNLTDLNSNSTSGAFVPPFPGIYEQVDNRRQQIYPGKIDGMAQKMDEIPFIENLLNGVMGLKLQANKIIQEQTENRNYENEIRDERNRDPRDVRFFMSSLTDGFKKTNPYVNAGSELGEILYFFTLRYAQSLYQLESAAEIGKIEAANFLAIHPNPISSIKDAVKNATSSDGNPFSFLEQYYNDNKNNLLSEITIDGDKVLIPKISTPVYFESMSKNVNSTVLARTYTDTKVYDTYGKDRSNDVDAIKNQIDVLNSNFPNMYNNLTVRVDVQPYVHNFANKDDISDYLGFRRNRVAPEGFGEWYFNGCSTDENLGFYTDGWFKNGFGESDSEKAKDKQIFYFLYMLLANMYDGRGDIELLMTNGADSDVARSLIVNGLNNDLIFVKGIGKTSFMMNNCCSLYMLGCLLKHKGEEGWSFRRYNSSRKWDIYNLFDNQEIKYSFGFPIATKDFEEERFSELQKRIIDEFNKFRVSDVWTNIKKYLDRLSPTNKALSSEAKQYIWNNLVDVDKGIYIYNVVEEYNPPVGRITLDKAQYINFVTALNDAYKDKDTIQETYRTDFTKNDITDNYKLAIYNSLKNLYDKWANSYKRESFELRSPEDDRVAKTRRYELGNEYDTGKDIKEFDNFIFVDAFYNDISYKFKINPSTVLDLIVRQINAENNFSTYEFMAEIMQKNRMLFRALPVYNNYYNIGTIENIFRPDIYQTMKRGYGSTYMCMYTYEVSHVVEDNRSQDHLCGDGMDLCDVTGDVTPAELTDTHLLFGVDPNSKGLSITVPAFGVTYARQNQMYFKNIDVNMDNPRVTDYSIANLFALANPSKDNELETPHTVTNDIYSIYANRSYNCSVDMMGCANIMPMMYFQLNNIPMFRGAYMISNVEHHIKAGDFTTRFTGVRINKNQIPFNDNIYNLDNMLDFRSDGTGTIHAGTYINAICTDFDVAAAVRRMSGSISCRTSRGTITVNNPRGTTNSNHVCACCVRQFIVAGLKSAADNGSSSAAQALTVANSGLGNGIQLKDSLPTVGFELFRTLEANMSREDRINFYRTNCIAGDVAVMYHGNHNYGDGFEGHACMYDGNVWVSDFVQTEVYVYESGGRNSKPIYIFRYKNCNRISLPATCDPENYNRNTGNSPSYPFRIFNITRSNEWNKWDGQGVNITPFSSLNTYGMRQDAINACRRFTTHSDAVSACKLFLLYIKEKYFDQGLNTPEKIVNKYCPPSAAENRNSQQCKYAPSIAKYLTKYNSENKTYEIGTVISWNKETICLLGEIMARIEQTRNVVRPMEIAWDALYGS